ncbi:BA75_04965T0 [Komagataella pastoris]|uniref:BA75_04965T0 n=1 Tax=Komagataella pastoris TaxID=4922 RepID=A0A1B2JI24_PICPA|nr:BA75_04965T0 [Komagataella pastoris]
MNLPIEIWSLISDHLDGNDLIKTRMTNHCMWQKLQDNELWRPKLEVFYSINKDCEYQQYRDKGKLFELYAKKRVTKSQLKGWLLNLCNGTAQLKDFQYWRKDLVPIFLQLQNEFQDIERLTERFFISNCLQVHRYSIFYQLLLSVCQQKKDLLLEDVFVAFHALHDSFYDNFKRRNQVYEKLKKSQIVEKNSLTNTQVVLTIIQALRRSNLTFLHPLELSAMAQKACLQLGIKTTIHKMFLEVSDPAYKSGSSFLYISKDQVLSYTRENMFRLLGRRNINFSDLEISVPQFIERLCYHLNLSPFVVSLFRILCQNDCSYFEFQTHKTIVGDFLRKQFQLHLPVLQDLFPNFQDFGVVELDISSLHKDYVTCLYSYLYLTNQHCSTQFPIGSVIKTRNNESAAIIGNKVQKDFVGTNKVVIYYHCLTNKNAPVICQEGSIIRQRVEDVNELFPNLDELGCFFKSYDKSRGMFVPNIYLERYLHVSVN